MVFAALQRAAEVVDQVARQSDDQPVLAAEIMPRQASTVACRFADLRQRDPLQAPFTDQPDRSLEQPLLGLVAPLRLGSSLSLRSQHRKLAFICLRTNK